MAKVGAQRAADLTGRSKSTIQRAMNNGKLSYDVDDGGRRMIDVSELERVFGLAPAGNQGSSGNTQQAQADVVAIELQRAKDMLEMERLRMRVRMLEDQLFVSNQQMEDLKGQRDEWQKQAQQVLITSQFSQKQAEDLKVQLAERDRREEMMRQKRMEERMKQLQGRNTNENPQPAKSGQVLKKPQHPAVVSAKAAGAGAQKGGFFKKLLSGK